MLRIPVLDNLILGAYTPHDAPALFQAIDKNRNNLRTWLSWVDYTIKEEHSLDFIYGAQIQLQQQTGLALGVFLEDKLVGGIGMHDWDHQLKKAEIGYWLDQGYQRKGIMYKCAAVFVDYLFARLQLNKIEIRFHPANDRSAAVAKRLGFKVEGILRDAQKKNGMYQDVVVTGLLHREWYATKQGY